MGNRRADCVDPARTPLKNRKKKDCKAQGGFAMEAIMVKSGHGVRHLLMLLGDAAVPTADSFDKKQA
jgi:hypothetical protein